MSTLKNKIIVVTGGSGLLGKAFINSIRESDGIAINFDLNLDADLERHKYPCDITNSDSIKLAVGEVVKKYGRIDGLVNNAYPRTQDWGIDFSQEPMDSWRKNIDLQLNSHIEIIKAIAPVMTQQSMGSIVNITSIYGMVGNDMSLYAGTKISTAAPYAAIKGGMINFSRYLSSYYGKNNIRVNCVSPGGIFDHQDPQFVSRYNEKVPLGRMGTPEDIAPGVVFLLSDNSKYITGHNLVVDGGWTAI